MPDVNNASLEPAPKSGMHPMASTATPQQLERAVAEYLALGSPSQVPSCRVNTVHLG